MREADKREVERGGKRKKSVNRESGRNGRIGEKRIRILQENPYLSSVSCVCHFSSDTVVRPSSLQT